MDAKTDIKMIVLTVFVYIYMVYKDWSKTSFYFGFWWGTTIKLSSWGIYKLRMNCYISLIYTANCPFKTHY